jgi:predicted aldo/keto reductase-like oxidoreductase
VLPKGNFAHAAFKWVWSNEAVAGLVVTMGTVEKLERYARASGGTLAFRDRDDLRRMAAATSADVCRIGCGDCLSSCPAGVNVPTIFRHDMYYADYGDVERARGGYARLQALGESAAACFACASQACANACTYGVPIRDGLLAAHGRLS